MCFYELFLWKRMWLVVGCLLERTGGVHPCMLSQCSKKWSVHWYSAMKFQATRVLQQWIGNQLDSCLNSDPFWGFMWSLHELEELGVHAAWMNFFSSKTYPELFCKTWFAECESRFWCCYKGGSAAPQAAEEEEEEAKELLHLMNSGLCFRTLICLEVTFDTVCGA